MGAVFDADRQNGSRSVETPLLYTQHNGHAWEPVQFGTKQIIVFFLYASYFYCILVFFLYLKEISLKNKTLYLLIQLYTVFGPANLREVCHFFVKT